MNDRHIYRGKRVDNGEWAYGCHSYSGDGRHTIDVINNLDEYEEMHVIDPATLGQCTGLPDCNKKLIFEGDICRIQDYECNYVVEWIGAAWFLIIKDSDFDNEWLYQYAEECFIIGNIHDNPELLREGENGET